MNAIWLLALVPPAAFYSGWYLARRTSARRSGARVNELSSDYFKGLNYLLNEEQDKALEVFLRLAEYNRDTVETHLALGNLFRKRGEVDRAIRLHQHLVSRPGLNEETKTVALLELGEDYMRAGLLDRAETLFSDLVAMDALAPSALRHLVAIYQHEREWHKAIDHARRLETMTGEDESPMIAQFYCELAEQSRSHGARVEASEYLAEAFRCQTDCVRAHMLTGRLLAESDDYAGAVDAYEQRAELCRDGRSGHEGHVDREAAADVARRVAHGSSRRLARRELDALPGGRRTAQRAPQRPGGSRRATAGDVAEEPAGDPGSVGIDEPAARQEHADQDGT